MTTQYVAGFMFDQQDPSRVALISKLKPEWQKGKLNAIGGKVEPGEHPLDAMVREFKEETGVDTKVSQWKKFVFLGDENRVFFFVTEGPVDQLKSMEDEQVAIFSIDCVTADNAIPNLTWLLPLARLALNNQTNVLLVTEL
jgi:8-oxo-dGTP diphosphatase